MTLCCLLSSGAGVVVGCKSMNKPASYTYQISVDDTAGLPLQAFKIDGTIIPVLRQSSNVKTFELVVPSQEHLVDKTMTVLVVTTCGGTELRAKTSQGNPTVEDYERERAIENQKNGKTPVPILEVNAQFTPPDEVLVYIDNDGATTTPVAIGVTPITASPTRVAIGTCPTATEVKVAGAAVGLLAPKARASGQAPAAGAPAVAAKKEVATAFIDVAGGHCYEQMGAKTETLESHRVYSVDIDDFLKPPDAPPPKSDRSEIRRCAPKKPEKPTAKKKK